MADRLTYGDKSRGGRQTDPDGPMRNCPTDQSVVINTGVLASPTGTHSYKLTAFNGNRDATVLMVVLHEVWAHGRVMDSECMPEIEIPSGSEVFLGNGVEDAHTNFPVGDWWIMYHSRFK